MRAITWGQGTINVTAGTTDIFLQAVTWASNPLILASPTTLDFGNGPTAGGAKIVPAGTTAFNAHVSGIVRLTDDNSVFGSMDALMTFVVEPGAVLQTTRNNAQGSGTGIASIVVRNAGTLQ